MISLPYTAWGAELSTDYDQRANLTASREGFALFGTLVAIAWPAIMGTGQADAATLSSLAWFLVIVLPPIMLLTLRTVPERPVTPHPIGWRAGWQLLRANRPFLRLYSPI